MKRLQRIEIEPLSQQRWAKIERVVFASLSAEAPQPAEFPASPRRVFGVRFGLIAAALAAVCMAAVIALRLGDPVAVAPPSRIITGPSASHLALPGVSLDVEPQSAVVVDSESRQGLLIVLDRGRVVCEVAPRSESTPLIVQAGAMRVRVIGTRFSVTRVGDSARVAVSHGTVEVSILGQTRRVHAGESWPPELTAPAAIEPELGPEPSASPAEATVAPAPVPASAVASLRPRAKSAASRVTAEPHAAPSADSQSDAGQKRRQRQAVFEEAAALERSDPARASELYRSLEAGGDSWSQNALYARGRLAASRGNAAAARTALELYLARFPRGSNAEDARAVLQRLR